MPYLLPPRLYRADVVRVQALDAIEVILDLNFGIHLRKRITLEGWSPQTIAPKLRSAAQHCMIVLLGGKSILVLTDDTNRNDTALGRVYLAEKLAPDYTGPGLLVPPGLDKPALEVTTFLQHLSTRSFDKSDVIRLLNGAPRELK